MEKKQRVPKGEKYHFIRELIDNLRHKISNYFPFGDEETKSMARKLRAVLNGADVIEMPSEEEISKH